MVEDVKEKMKQLPWPVARLKTMPVTCASLIFPALDTAAAASPTTEEERNSEGLSSSIKAKSRSVSKFVNDYYDRRAQASYAYQNPESTLTAQAAPLAPKFQSRFADPNNATNTHFLTLITGCKCKAEPLRPAIATSARNAKRAQAIRAQSSRRLLRENVLYLLVDIPTAKREI